MSREREFKVINSGDNGWIVEGLQCSPDLGETDKIHLMDNATEYKGPVVTKIVISDTIFQKDVQNTHNLYSLDPQQLHFVYPIAFCKSHVTDYMKQSIDKLQHINTVNVMIMPDGGMSLKQYNASFTEPEAKKIISDIQDALAILHGRNLAHGDLHDGNVLIDKDETGRIRARLIDCDNMYPENKQRDIDDFGTLILETIAAQVSDKDYKTKLNERVNNNRKRVLTLYQTTATPSPSPKRKHRGRFAASPQYGDDATPSPKPRGLFASSSRSSDSDNTTGRPPQKRRVKKPVVAPRSLFGDEDEHVVAPRSLFGDEDDGFSSD